MSQRSFIGLGLCVILAALTGCGGSGEEPASNAGNAGASGTGGTSGGGTSCPATPAFDLVMTPRNLEPGDDDPAPLYDFATAGGRLFFKRYTNPASAIRTPLMSIPTQGGDPQELLPDHFSYTASGSDLIVDMGDRHRLVRVPQAGGTVTELPPIVHDSSDSHWAGNIVVLDDTVEYRTAPNGDDERLTMFITHDIETGAEKEIGSIWEPLEEFVVDEALYVTTEDESGLTSFSSVPLAGGEFTTVLQTNLTEVDVYSTHGPEWLIVATQPPETRHFFKWMSPADGSVREISGGPIFALSVVTWMARAEHGYVFNFASDFYFLPDGADAFVSMDVPCLTDNQHLFEVAVEGNFAFANLSDSHSNAIVRIPLPN